MKILKFSLILGLFFGVCASFKEVTIKSHPPTFLYVGFFVQEGDTVKVFTDEDDITTIVKCKVNNGAFQDATGSVEFDVSPGYNYTPDFSGAGFIYDGTLDDIH